VCVCVCVCYACEDVVPVDVTLVGKKLNFWNLLKIGCGTDSVIKIACVCNMFVLYIYFYAFYIKCHGFVGLNTQWL